VAEKLKNTSRFWENLLLLHPDPEKNTIVKILDVEKGGGKRS
jgi:hypothetical protein